MNKRQSTFFEYLTCGAGEPHDHWIPPLTETQNDIKAKQTTKQNKKLTKRHRNRKAKDLIRNTKDSTQLRNKIASV